MSGFLLTAQTPQLKSRKAGKPPGSSFLGAPPEARGDDNVKADEDRPFLPGALSVVDHDRQDPRRQEQADGEQSREDQRQGRREEQAPGNPQRREQGGA